MARMCITTSLLSLALTFAPDAKAGTDWVTGCENRGTISGWNVGRSFPKGKCSGKIVSFLAEPPGVRFAKRKKTLTAAGATILYARGPFLITTEWVTRDTEDPEFQELDGTNESEICGIFILGNGFDVAFSTPDELVLNDGGKVRLAFARHDSIESIFDTIELIAENGRTLRISDLKVIFDDSGCFGAGVFRFANNAKAFY